MSNIVRRRMTLEDLILAEAVRPVTSDQLSAGWIPELPMPVERYVDLESRMPEADFVPETVTDERLRRHFRARIQARQVEQIQRRRRSNQWGGLIQGLQPGNQGSLMRWYAEDDVPQAVNLQLGSTIDSSIVTPTLTTPSNGGPPILVNVAKPVVPADSDDINVYARIDWGGGGSAETAYCDVQQGTQIRLTASFINVSVYYNRKLPQSFPPVRVIPGGPAITPPNNTVWPDPFFFLPNITGPPVTVTAQLGCGGPQLNVSGARFTRKFGLVPPEGQILGDPIPPYASAYGVAFFDGAPGPISVLFQASPTPTTEATATTSVNTVTDETPTSDFRFMLPQGNRFLTVINSTNRQLGITVVYSLMMG